MLIVSFYIKKIKYSKNINLVFFCIYIVIFYIIQYNNREYKNSQYKTIQYIYFILYF